MDKNRFFKNILAFATVDILTLLIPLITMPLLTRSLGVETYGQYLLYMTFLMFGHMCVDFSCNYVAVRDIAKQSEKANHYKVSKIYSVTQRIRLITLVLYCSSLYIYYMFFFDGLFGEHLFISSIIYLIGYYFSANYFFIGIDKAKVVTYIVIPPKVITLLYVLFFRDVNLVDLLYVQAWPTLVIGVVSSVYCKKITKKIKFSVLYFKTWFKKGFDVFLGIIIPNTYLVLPLPLLQSISNPTDFAYLTIAMRLAGVMTTCINVINKSVFPIFSTKINNNSINKYLFSVCLISLLMISIPYFFEKEILHFITGQQYQTALPMLKVVSIGVLFSLITSAICQNYLLATGKISIYKRLSLATAMLSVIVIYVSIYLWAVDGYAISLTISRFITLIIFVLSYTSLVRKKIG
ncbi:oligosaccharide flippase family protein [Vibrio chagasii]|uniref:oligosaccharide flippase family protein n=1 Tax=Vibrio chagasii TaxID=170679 RepID=UPI0035A64ED0